MATIWFTSAGLQPILAATPLMSSDRASLSIFRRSELSTTASIALRCSGVMRNPAEDSDAFLASPASSC